ncbi:MAG: acyltransferase [Candidatus Symbiothrix sp.]|jgi:surface polysaccharide O-acyltransferase-like enzyme|nr:acyltransferase [Candidatus Symbiothrix sp.]
METRIIAEKKRIDSIDLLKGLAIYSVIIYHFNQIPTDFLKEDNGWFYFNYYIISFFSTCVPIFFFVNGALLLNKEKIDMPKHIHKIVKIIILTVLWGGITLISLSFIRKELLSPLTILKEMWVLKQDWNMHLWFLCALVVIYIFYPVLYTAYKTNKKVFYFFFVCVLLFTFGNIFIGNLGTTLSYITNKFADSNFQHNYWVDYNPFRGIKGYSIGYFMLGGILYNYRDVLNTPKFRILSIITILISMFLLFIYGVIASLRTGEIWDIVWCGYDTIFTLMNVVAIFIITMNYTSKGQMGKLINLIGKNSLGIYFIHIIIGEILKPLYSQTGVSSLLLANIIFALVILLCSLLLVTGLKKIPIVKYLFSI